MVVRVMTPLTIKTNIEDHFIAKLAAIAIVLSIIEFFLPSPIPVSYTHLALPTKDSV